jgi:hypothetical protein
MKWNIVIYILMSTYQDIESQVSLILTPVSSLIWNSVIFL